jgi:hypothetical protein
MRLLLTFVIALAILPQLFASENMLLRSGIYEVLSATNTSVCPQKINAKYEDKKLVSLKVVYVGDCYYMGPYTYSCNPESNKCGNFKDGRQYMLYTIHDEKSFHWENLAYHIEAELALDEATL